MEKQTNKRSISDILTPSFKITNPKINNHVHKIQQNKSSLVQNSPSNIQTNSQKIISLSNLIHSVSSYRKEIGDELKIDVDNIKPSNLIHAESNKSVFYPKSLYNKKNSYSLNVNSKKSSQKNIIKNGKYISNNNYNTNIDDQITLSIETENKKDFFDLFPVEKMTKFETKFLILLAKTKTKTTKYQREEYIKFLEDFKLNPFYEYFLNKNQIKNDNNLSVIKLSTNLLILSIISCLWVTNNNDIINNNEMINKFLIELITTDQQLYLLLCLYILNEIGYLNNNQKNGLVMKLMEQIKTYLNPKLNDFRDIETILEEIKNTNLKINKIITKILNFENLYCVDISNCLRNINIINIPFLYSLFETLTMDNNIYMVENTTETKPNVENCFHSLYQRHPLSDLTDYNKNMNNNRIYIKKFGNYLNRKIQNKNNIDNINKNNDNINNEINNEVNNNIFNNTEVDNSNNKFININQIKSFNNANYSDQINNVYNNKNCKSDITNKTKKINTKSIMSHIRNYNNISENILDHTANDKSSSNNNKTNNYPIIDTSENMAEYQPKYFPHKNKKFNKYKTDLDNNNKSIPINTENDYQKYINNRYNSYYPNNYFNTNDNYETISTNVIRLNKNNKINQAKINYLSQNLNIPNVPYLKKNNSGKKFTLILDLDETLVQFNYNKMMQNNNEKKVILRPGLFEFLNKIYPIFELVIWTVSTKQYSDPIIDIIEEKKKYFSTRLYREHTTEKSNYFVKDLTKLGREIDKIIIIDDKEISFSLQPENGILIKPFLGSYLECRNDNVLFDLFKILTKIILVKSQDVREGIENYKYEIQQKVSKIYRKTFTPDNNKDNINKNDYEINAFRTVRNDVNYNKKYKKYEKIMNQNCNSEKYGRYNSVKMTNIQGVKSKY